MYPEDRPRRSVRRESAGVTEEPKKKSGITLLAQVGVCAVLVLAAFLFKLSGNGAFFELQEQYMDAMSKQVTFEEAWAQVEEMADRYAVLAFFVEPIHSIQEAFSFQPSQGGSSAPSDVSGPDGTSGTSSGASSAPSNSSPSQAPASSASSGDDGEVSAPGDLTPTGVHLGAGGEDILTGLFGNGAKLPPEKTSFAPYFLTAPLSPPLQTATITSTFDYRTHPITGEEGFHTGLDLATAEGTPIASVLPGIVAKQGYNDKSGNFVIVSHGSGVETLYAHCSKITAADGAYVRAGETIALVGSTGDSTGPHLHIELAIDGVKMDLLYALSRFGYDVA